MPGIYSSDVSTDGRRMFLKRFTAGIAGVTMGLAGWPDSCLSLPKELGKSRVSFVTGGARRDMVVRSLEPFREEIRDGIGDRRVIIKINMAGKIPALSNTHPDAIRGVLDFLAPICNRRITVAECTLSDEGFVKLSEQYGYHPLTREYDIDLLELHDGPTTSMSILGKNLHPLRIEILDTMLDPDNYIISLTPPKIHDVVVATIGLKNILMASPKNIEGISSKYSMHGQGPWWLNYNLFVLAQRIRPSFTVIDGFEGMEGDGPIRGTKVEHGFALAGSDVVAVDRIALDLMEIDLADVGYITYCGDAGLGNTDRSKIEIIGRDKPGNHVIKYKKHKAFKFQEYWKKDVDIVDWDPKDLPY